MYRVNEVFYSIQGEGARSGTANVFVRFAGCNLACSADADPQKLPGGQFDCDTEFSSGERYTAEQLVAVIEDAGQGCKNVIFTGGEPGLQLDEALISRLPGYHLAVETNGTRALPPGLSWVTASPKTAEHTLRLEGADEVKYVRQVGQGIPRPRILARYKFLSPAFTAEGRVDMATVAWCVALVKENPEWRLSLQMHKFIRIR